MKKILFCSMFLVATRTSFCQQMDTSQVNTREYYLKKSKSQLIGGLILLGVGGTTIALVGKGNTSFDELPLLAVGGSLCLLGSIPLFIASGRNKRKASNATTYLKMEKIPVLQQAGLKFHSYPAISVKIIF